MRLIYQDTARALASTLFPADAVTGAPAGGEIIIEPLEALLSGLPRGDRIGLKVLLGAFEHGALLTRERGRFTRLDPEARARYVAGWMRSPNAQRRVVYRTLRELFGLLYYQHPATWEALGYPGPPVSREA